MSQSNGNAAHRRVLVGLSALAVLGFFIATLVDLDPSSRVLSAANALTFTEIASTAGVTAPADSNGSSVVDVDGDGLEDLVLIGAVGSTKTITLYRSNGDGTFSDATASWPGLRPSDGTVNSTFWADFDNDGDADVALAMGSPLELRFLRNNRIGTAEQSFTQISSLAGHALLASWADFDNDGDL
ncbi:MAG: VCBS repeat-containing protein, partial [Dehalococcoidia bacterium]|nr:VCBS repeat-containing protein [Dehalococcoidia bacterium]